MNNNIKVNLKGRKIMQVYNVTDDAFKAYGQVLVGYDFSDILKKLKTLSIPEEGIIYEASVATLEEDAVFEPMTSRGFGGMPIQIGYVGGNNKQLNCLEYHKNSEFNIALDDVVLVLGLESEIKNGKFDTKNCKCFLVPAGVGVELYGTTLHYAPMNVSDNGYRVLCVLPLGTNGAKPELETITFEDKMCAGSNKWLMAHESSNEAKNGAYIGLEGENISFNILKF